MTEGRGEARNPVTAKSLDQKAFQLIPNGRFGLMSMHFGQCHLGLISSINELQELTASNCFFPLRERGGDKTAELCCGITALKLAVHSLKSGLESVALINRANEEIR